MKNTTVGVVKPLARRFQGRGTTGAFSTSAQLPQPQQSSLLGGGQSAIAIGARDQARRRRRRDAVFGVVPHVAHHYHCRHHGGGVKRCWSSSSSSSRSRNLEEEDYFDTTTTSSRPSSSSLASSSKSRSFSTLPDHKEDPSYNYWETRVNRLLQIPIGTFTDETWEEADEALRFLTNNRINHNSSHNHINDDGGASSSGSDRLEVNLSFQLMDRLAQEEIILLKFDPINAIVYNWRNSILRDNTSNNTTTTTTAEHDQSILLLPSQVVSHLDSWREKSGRFQPDTKTYTMVLEVAAFLAKNHNTDHVESVFFADSLLEWMITESRSHSTIRPTTISFAAVLNAWVWSSRSGRSTNDFHHPEEVCTKVEQWIQRLEALHNEGWPDLQPNIVLYNIQLNAWARAGRVDRALELLQQMMLNDNENDDYNDSDKEENFGHSKNYYVPVRPDQTSFSTVLSAYAKSAHHNAPQQAEELLDKMQEWYNAGRSSVPPNALSYTTVMNAWAARGLPAQAERVLEKFEKAYRISKDPDLKPDVVTYNVLLHAWVRAQRPDRAEQLLHTMYEKGGEIRPNQISFNTVLAAWAKVGAAEEAEAILTAMHKLSQEQQQQHDGDWKVKPDLVSYNTVLDAWASSSGDQRRYAWKRALAILHHMEDIYRHHQGEEGGHHNVRPNARTWNTVINCAAKAGQIDLTEQLLEEFYKAAREHRVDGIPAVRTWNTLLSACLKKGEAHRARGILDQMKAMSSSSSEGEGVAIPDIVSYNTVLHCHARSNHRDAGDQAMAVFRQLEEDETVQPNRISYLALINAWIKSGKPNEAEAVLMDMLQKGVDLDKDGRDIFHKLITAWSKHQAPRKAEALLFQMVDRSNQQQNNRHDDVMSLKPTTETYNRVLNAWARAKVSEAGERADLILRQMEDLASAGDDDSAPDVVSYNSVLNAWANSGDPTAVTRTEHLVLEMILKGDATVTPTEVTYGTWLKTIESSARGDKARRTREVLQTMKIHNFEPSAFLLKKIEKLKSMRN